MPASKKVKETKEITDDTQKIENCPNITKTGYRILLLFKLLLESPRSRQDINEAFEKDPVLQKGISNDTITNIVRALRESGCIIKRPDISTQYKYVLIKHPFSTEISENVLNGLQKIREGITSFANWQLLYKTNRLYEKFSVFTVKNEDTETLLHRHALKKVDENFVKQLVKYCETKQILKVKYRSKFYNTECTIFIPDFVMFENMVMYLWGYNLRYKNIGYLRIDRLKSVSPIFFSNAKLILEQYKSDILTVTYKLTGFSRNTYTPGRFERIIIENKDYIVVEAKVLSKFNFLQRIISFGTDCRLLTPQSYVHEFLLELKNVKALYTNEKQKSC